MVLKAIDFIGLEFPITTIFADHILFDEISIRPEITALQHDPLMRRDNIWRK